MFNSLIDLQLQFCIFTCPILSILGYNPFDTFLNTHASSAVA